MYPVMQYARMVARTSGITVDPATPPMIGANTTVLCVCVKERGGGGGGEGGGIIISNRNESGSGMVYMIATFPGSHVPGNEARCRKTGNGEHHEVCTSSIV